MIKKNVLFFSLLFLVANSFAQNVKTDFKTSSISIFKNGTAFFIKSGKIKTNKGSYRISKNIPSALFGTYWVNTPNDNIKALSSYVDTLSTAKKILANSISEILRANQGKQVKLYFRQDETSLSGVVEEIEKANPANSNSTIRYLVNFRTANKWMSFAASDVKRVEFLEKPSQTYQLPQEEITPILQVDFKAQKPSQELSMMYLSNGLSWTPIYLIELLSEEQAQLTLRAEVVNNIEDIKKTDVNFVVGVPNFNYADKLSALINFSNIVSSSRGNNNFANFSNTFSTQTYSIEANGNTAGGTISATGIQGSSEEDLYFYTLKNMSLKKGGRGHYPIFETKIKIAHIYETNLPPNNPNKQSYRSDYLFSPNPNKIFHSIKVNNDTQYPFTTGPALVVKQQGETKPISQDRLNYTSVGGNSFVKLTEAPDVRIKQGEKVIKRAERAKKLTRGGSIYSYDLLTVEGQIKVNNYKNKKINLNIRRTILGDLKKSSIKWLKAARVNTYGQANVTTDVCWETSLNAGEELEITYTYQIHVLH
ncbi:MAG: DUF4139 domain-containing protein [Saprospiraceae bacterium]